MFSREITLGNNISLTGLSVFSNPTPATYANGSVDLLRLGTQYNFGSFYLRSGMNIDISIDSVYHIPSFVIERSDKTNSNPYIAFPQSSQFHHAQYTECGLYPILNALKYLEGCYYSQGLADLDQTLSTEEHILTNSVSQIVLQPHWI